MPTRSELQTKYRGLPLRVLLELASDRTGLTPEAWDVLCREFDRRGVTMDLPVADGGEDERGVQPDGFPARRQPSPPAPKEELSEEDRRHRRLATAILALTTAGAAGAFGVLVFEFTEFDTVALAVAFYSAAGCVAGALVGLVAGPRWTRSLRGATLYQALALGLVVHVPCGLLTLALTTAFLGQTQGFWSGAMSLIFGIAFGLFFVLVGGLIAGAAYHVLSTDERPE